MTNLTETQSLILSRASQQDDRITLRSRLTARHSRPT